MLSSVRFGSLLIYSPQGTGDVSVESRRARDQIKRAVPSYLDRVAELIPEHDVIAEMFGDDVVLVPAPGSAPLHKGAIWTPERLCKAMLKRGLGSVVAPWLRRVQAVPKSATSAPTDRPRARRHYDSMVAEPHGAIAAPVRIVVVDDFVTRGATLLGACSRMADVFPGADVRGFAAVRTMTDVEIVGMVDPVVGEVTLEASGETRRRP